MAHGFFYLTDHNSPTGSRLFNGSTIKCWVSQCTIAGKNNLDVPFKPNQELELTSNDQLETGTAGNIGSNWNRRKGNIQYVGAENIQIVLSGGWNVNQVGSLSLSTSGSEYTLSPWKLMRMGNSGHTFFIKGGTAIQWILEGEAEDISPGGNHTGSYYIPGSGIPIQIATWSIEDAATDEDYVSWEMVCTEDKDTINMSN